MEKNKKTLMLSIFGILTLVLITVGVTYAFFSYSKEGTTENTITTGTITFIYEEIDKQGAGISIEDAYPISDEVGKAMTASNEVFNFKVKSETTSAQIPYTVTARMKEDSTLSQEAVRIYLTEVVGENETELLLDNYNNLTQTSITVPEGTVEKEIYTDTVPVNSNPYEKNFRLRMWIDEDTNFSDGTMNDKTFTVTVNVYANAEVVSVPDATTYTAYNIGYSVTAIDGSKWHVLEASDETNPNVVLLSDYNLNSDGSYNTTCGNDINSTHVCSPMAFDPDNTNTYDELDSDNVGYFIKNTYEPLVTDSLPGTTNVTLPEYDQIRNISNSSSISLPWLASTNYWTQTQDTTNSTNVHYVYGRFSSLSSSSALTDNESGARPLITTPKTNLIAE